MSWWSVVWSAYAFSARVWKVVEEGCIDEHSIVSLESRGTELWLWMASDNSETDSCFGGSDVVALLEMSEEDLRLAIGSISDDSGWCWWSEVTRWVLMLLRRRCMVGCVVLRMRRCLRVM